jgi:hypothetical protein
VAGNDAFGGAAGSLLFSGGSAFFPEPLHGGFVVTVVFGECLFTVHETGTGLFTEFFDLGCSDVSHDIL